jgi:hypothetical protein
MQDSTLRKNIEIGVIAVAIFIAIPILYFSLPKKGDVVVINCSIAEISPDFTNEMREACRQHMAKEFQKNLQKPK